jgi:HAE1 family hydrophobic/amphiphilic exporter-1
MLQDVTSDLLITNPQVNIEIDRDKASALGITANHVESGLSMAYSAQQVSTIYAPNNQYQVIMQVQEEYQRDPAALSMLYIRSSGGQLVPLRSVSRLSQNVGPLSVNHLGQLPAVTLSFNTRPGVSLGTAIDAVNKVVRNTIPASLTTSFQGTAQAFQSSMQGLGILLLAATLVIYIVLGILYESFIHPLTILSALPFAGFGALVTLMLFGSDLNVYAFVGVILLVGLVKKNGIMMVDFALDAQRKESARRGRDLQGLHDTLPAYHDDYHGRAPGYASNSPRIRRRGGVAETPGSCRGRRSSFFADIDTLCHSCCVPVYGSVAEKTQRSEDFPGTEKGHDQRII